PLQAEPLLGIRQAKAARGFETLERRLGLGMPRDLPEVKVLEQANDLVEVVPREARPLLVRVESKEALRVLHVLPLPREVLAQEEQAVEVVLAVEVAREETATVPGLEVPEELGAGPRLSVKEVMEHDEGLRFRVGLPEVKGLGKPLGRSALAGSPGPPRRLAVEARPAPPVGEHLVRGDQLPHTPLGPGPAPRVLVGVGLD